MSLQHEFKKLLEEGVAKAGGKQALAQVLGVRNSTVTNWVLGSSPKLENFDALACYVETGRILKKKKNGSKNK